ncbi:MAG: methylmalonyl Co-A mutase-associated GTPase MeaB [Pseudomonadota bacterium]
MTAASQPMTSPLVDRVLAGDRRALARAITLVESARADHRQEADALVTAARGSGRQALRIGLSGTPGVGKSTFIETFGLRLVDAGHRVAVLAVDPSSTRTGGSILGDKTRMERLARAPGAYIRPSPSQTHLGGVARRTREAIALCEGAGFDIVLVETVGVGQSETMVADMTDLFVLLLAPAGGDELQGVKRGIMEIADLILINKADGDLEPAAKRTVADYAGALRLLRKRPEDPPEYPKALAVSATADLGIDTAWKAMTDLADWRRAEGHWTRRRAGQDSQWFEEELSNGLQSLLAGGVGGRKMIDRLRTEVESGQRAPTDAASEALQAIKNALSSK